jgi:hypothetical protein
MDFGVLALKKQRQAKRTKNCFIDGIHLQNATIRNAIKKKTENGKLMVKKITTSPAERARN